MNNTLKRRTEAEEAWIEMLEDRRFLEYPIHIQDIILDVLKTEGFIELTKSELNNNADFDYGWKLRPRNTEEMPFTWGWTFRRFPSQFCRKQCGDRIVEWLIWPIDEYDGESKPEWIGMPFAMIVIDLREGYCVCINAPLKEKRKL